MHLNTEQILWALVLAAHLILLIVLLGRELIRRFPWFTAAITLSSVQLIADHLLHGKLTSLAFYWQSYTATLLADILGILVLIELLRHVFYNCKCEPGRKANIILNSKGWLGWTLVTASIAAGAVWQWGPWPAWTALNADPKQLPILLVVLSAMKGQLFLAILTVEVGLLMRIFGKRFGSGWKSPDQQIMLGLSTYALGFLAVQVTTDIIKRTVHLTSRDQYEHIVRLFANLDNSRFALWFLVIVWWTVWLWRITPPGSASQLAAEESPVLAGPPSLKAEPETTHPEPDLPHDSRLDSE
jgi:hypothetical protein